MKKVWIYDIESWTNFFSITFEDRDSNEVRVFYVFGTINQLRELVEFLKNEVAGLIGFKNNTYDYPLIHFIILNATKLISTSGYEASYSINIESNIILELNKGARIRNRDVLIPQLDLYEIHHFDNKNKMTSLKYVEININFENVEDLPFEPNYVVQEEDIPTILDYNLNDVRATKKFYELSKADVDMRKLLKNEFGFGMEFMNYNDPKIGEEIFLKEMAKEMGISAWDLRQLRTHRDIINLKDVVLDNIYFKSPQFNRVLSKFKNTIITGTKKPFEFSVIYKGFKYDYGVGGIHGCIAPGIYNADDDHIIYDIDIDGMYPSTALLFKFFPEHLGLQFTRVYQKLYDKRMVAKRKSKVDKTDISAKAINSGLKLANNGVYGKSNDQYSFLYDPKFTMQITVNGQLLLSMLAERIADINGLIMLQVNTDGVTVKIHKSREQEFLDICKNWEKETGYTLEYAQYKKMVIRDVNNYLAQYIDGSLKHKGVFEVIPMQNGKIAYNKNWSMRIVPIALEKYYINETPIEETIRNHDNIYDFCIGIKLPGSYIARFTELIENTAFTKIFKKTLRYYISTKGSYLWKVDTVSKKESQVNVGFAVRPFNKFEIKENYYINYEFYIAECRKIMNVIDDGQLKLF